MRNGPRYKRLSVVRQRRRPGGLSGSVQRRSRSVATQRNIARGRNSKGQRWNGSAPKNFVGNKKGFLDRYSAPRD
ncbi:hypothetical protein D9M69_663330 [compost metagenome]